MWTIACSRSERPGGAGELVRVVGDRGGVAGGARVAQRQRLQQQPEHALVADVELVGPALDLLRVHLALEQRPQQQLVDAEREREEADDPGAEDLEAVDGHRGHHGRGDLPRQHRDEDRAQHLDQRAAAQEARVAGDHQEVQGVGGEEDGEDRERVAALARSRRWSSACRASPPSSGNVVYVSRLLSR